MVLVRSLNMVDRYRLCAFILILITCLLVSCQERRTTQRSMQERIEALNDEGVGTINLGTGQAHPTDNTEFIVSHHEEAVPLLVEALKDEKKPIKVGYAAYILRRIRSDAGKQMAAETTAKISAKGSSITVEERFALRELRDYLDALDGKPSSQ